PPLELVDRATLFARTEAYLKTLIGEELKLAPDRIESSHPLASFGIDSVIINRINSSLERDLGALPKTLLYEYETVGETAEFLGREVRERLGALFGFASAEGSAIPLKQIQEKANPDEIESSSKNVGDLEPIAIIGIHACYPHSPNLDEYWENLKQGK